MDEELPDPPRRRRLADLALTWGLPLLLLVGFRSAIAAPFHVPSGSMVPTLEVGDRMVVSKSSYGLNVPWMRFDGSPGLGVMTTREVVSWSEPQRGDVILFRYPLDPSVDYVKRVVAVPGDEVEVRGGRVFVNGVAQRREADGTHDYVDDRCQSRTLRRYVEDLNGVRHPVLEDRPGPLGTFGPLVVPEGKLFVMGDNRDHSADSRAWGLVPRENVRGRAVGVWMTTGCDGDLAFGWRPID